MTLPQFFYNQKFWLVLFALLELVAAKIWPNEKEFIGLLLPLFMALVFAMLGIEGFRAWVQRAYILAGRVLPADEKKQAA